MLLLVVELVTMTLLLMDGYDGGSVDVVMIAVMVILALVIVMVVVVLVLVVI